MMTKSGEPFGRTIGILVFLAGIGLLAIIFKEALAMLASPVPDLDAIVRSVSQPAKSAHVLQANPFPAVGAVVVAFFLKLALMFVGVVSGSIIASKGIHLYFTAGTVPMTPGVGGSSAGIVDAISVPSKASKAPAPPQSSAE